MFTKLRNFSQWQREDKLLFIEAFFTLGFMRAGILALSFKYLTRHLKQYPQQAPTQTCDDQDLLVALNIKKAIHRAVRKTPWESACLAQSLTAQRMLSRRQIASVFYLGLSINLDDKNEQDEAMKAHAWSQYAGQMLTGEAGHEDYTVVSVFEWSRA